MYFRKSSSFLKGRGRFKGLPRRTSAAAGKGRADGAPSFSGISYCTVSCISWVNNSMAGLTHFLRLYPQTAEMRASVNSVLISANSPLCSSFSTEKVGR